MFTEWSKAERQAVEEHRSKLSAEQGHDVSLAEAVEDWTEHYAFVWRQRRHAQMMAMEREEILRHKWIESEKNRRDVGAEAVFDWIHRYAATWRRWFEEEYEG